MLSFNKYIKFTFVGALALLASSQVAFAQEDRRSLTMTEAVACMDLISQVDGLMYALTEWSEAMGYWRDRADNRATQREARSYDGVNSRLLRAYDHTESIAERYDRQCSNVSITREMFEQICSNSSNSFCEALQG